MNHPSTSNHLQPPAHGPWQVIRSEYLYREPWLTVRKETIALPNGHRIPAYYVLEYPQWVNVIGITAEGQFVMVRQYRHGLAHTAFELCAGVVDPEDADPLAAAQRELLEETGYGGGAWQAWMTLAPNPSTQNNLTYTFLATELAIVAAPRPEPSEDISVHLMSPEEVRQLLERNEIIQALHAAPLWKYFAGR